MSCAYFQFYLFLKIILHVFIVSLITEQYCIGETSTSKSVHGCLLLLTDFYLRHVNGVNDGYCFHSICVRACVCVCL